MLMLETVDKVRVVECAGIGQVMGAHLLASVGFCAVAQWKVDTSVMPLGRH